MSDLLRFSVPGKVEYISAIRMAVSQFASCGGFDMEELEDIKVALSEVCQSMVCWGQNVENYDVTCELERGKICISIEDKGLLQAPHICRDSCGGFSEEAGLGLFILKSLMDEVDILSEMESGTRITMIKYQRR